MDNGIVDPKKKKGLIPLYQRMGLTEGMTTKQPSMVLSPTQLGNMVSPDIAGLTMEQRKANSEVPGGMASMSPFGQNQIKKQKNKVARLGSGRTREEIFNA